MHQQPFNLPAGIRILFILLVWISIQTALVNTAVSTEKQDASESDTVTALTDTLAGHSYHGEAFNEGPRQAAILLPNLGSISFPSSATQTETQQFIEQGILQLHGFWYLEAERSFRQASMLEPNLAIPYWGMAMANQNNADRARGFIDQALQRVAEGADDREELYVKALDQLIPKKQNESDSDKKKDVDEKEEKKQRAERYIAAMEKILDHSPHDIEAKAFIAVQMWMANGYGVKITSRYAVDALLTEVFNANPAHPAHHYRIHLWDRNRPENALGAAAQCGPASPGIAHMWHMPGHIYSKLKRYQDAAWQQEASARVDHAHMINTRLMPDEIHNFAHNNEWLVRNLVFVGRVNEAITLAKNLISLPKHPKYNTLEKRGSHKFGRQRLIQVLTEYELWDQLLQESDGPFLTVTGNEEVDQERSAWIAVAHYLLGHEEQGAAIYESFKKELDEIEKQIESAEKQEQEETKSPAENTEESEQNDAESNQPTKEELEKKKRSLEPLVARIQCAKSVFEGNLESFKESEKQAKLETILKSRWLARLGDHQQALEIAKKQFNNDKSQIRPLATITQLLWDTGEKEEAIEKFRLLRQVAAYADLNTPMLATLKPVAASIECPEDWRAKPEPAKDLGPRPPLHELGPFRWEPYQAPAWNAITPDGLSFGNEDHQGKPTIIIYYLGFGCLHCVEQLHTFSPLLDEFKASGIDIIAVSTETVEELKHGIKNFDQPVSIPLLANAKQDAFKSYRCWDDFENQPLHGTFLIDAQGRVRWQDISYEPFNDPEFLLNESKRLLNLPSSDQKN